MMYTKEPLEQVFFSGTTPKCKQIQLEFGILELEEVGGRQCVKRLISTRPSDYLNTKYTPGRPAGIEE